MRLLVFGGSGQVGTELRRLCPPGWRLSAPGRDEVDLEQPGAAARAIAGSGAEAVINAAAFTAVDRAEAAPQPAWRMNAEVPGEMAVAAARAGVPLLHLSTDYVFDGAGAAPMDETHPVAPLSAYGRSKAAGEAMVRVAGGRHLILRTSWVFSAHGTNFLRSILRLGRAEDRLRVVDDQIGGPTPAAAIAAALLTLAPRLAAGTGPGGTFHFAGAPDASWAEFARAILAEAGLAAQVVPIASADWPTAAQRPRNSRLDCRALRAAHGIDRPDWRAALPGIIAELERDAP
ncbi:dTDP-4-dehydrorhamnose reductase [Plastorhodobacter daqingensis]|uniref:dTDP-4-dehydrorhamnose reductase n=1 Tax=Plastorhodobacter daqingensis TaxID=1387281 RepID=A0ABW2UJ91_9RHOB